MPIPANKPNVNLYVSGSKCCNIFVPAVQQKWGKELFISAAVSLNVFVETCVKWNVFIFSKNDSCPTLYWLINRSWPCPVQTKPQVAIVFPPPASLLSLPGMHFIPHRSPLLAWNIDAYTLSFRIWNISIVRTNCKLPISGRCFTTA